MLGFGAAAALAVLPVANAEAAMRKRPTAQHTKAAASSSHQLSHVERLPSTSTLVMDARSGTVLHAHNPDLKLYPASLVKILGDMVVYDMMRMNMIRADEIVPVPRHVTQEVLQHEGKEWRFLPRKEAPVQTMIAAKAVMSSNEAAKALGIFAVERLRLLTGFRSLANIQDLLRKPEDVFADLMQKKAQMIGCTHTRIRNATGLFDEAQVSTARDMALIGRHLALHYPEFYSIYGQKTFRDGPFRFQSHNKVLSMLPGADGIKTGYTEQCGASNLSSAVLDGRRVVMVTMGLQGAAPSSRAAQTNVELAKLGFSMLPKISVPNYVERSAPAAPELTLPAPDNLFSQPRRAKTCFSLIPDDLRPPSLRNNSWDLCL